MSKLDQRGVVHLLVPLILLLGIIGGVYLITAGPLKLFPKASVSGPISGPITPSPTPLPGKPSLLPSSLYLEQSLPPNVVMEIPAVPTSGYGIYVVLRDLNDKVITDQRDISYSWSVEDSSVTGGVWPFAACIEGIQPPCPEGNAYIGARREGSTNVTVRVTQISTQTEIAKATFPVTILPRYSSVRLIVRSPRWLRKERESFTFRVGENVPIRWDLASAGPYDYFNLYYYYYDRGKLKTGFIGKAGLYATSLDWTVPPELVGKRVKIVIQAMREDAIVGGGNSIGLFTVIPSPSPTPVACTINDLRAAFFARRGESRYNPACDINNDGRISVTDYSALLRNLRR